MCAFPNRPLGAPIPDSPHAVSCSLPTMRAVRGYEEKDPAITSHLTSGYPRFVVHPFARALAEDLAKRPAYAGKKIWLTSSQKMAKALAAHLSKTVESTASASTGAPVSLIADDGLYGVAHPDTRELSTEAKLFLQHIGGFISSREAEDQAVRRKLRAAAHPEPTFSGDAGAEVRRHLLPQFAPATAEDLFFAPSGMNAVYGAFATISQLQSARGRTGWIQLGWLYLDTIAILKKFTKTASDYHYFGNVFDLAPLEALLSHRGSQIAGLVTEIPTNPLIQTPDVSALSALCRKHGVALILDPSVASAYSVDILRHADMLVMSLTKYTASEGDVIAGLVAVNPQAPGAADYRRCLPSHVEPIYSRDLSRLAAQIGETTQVLQSVEPTCVRVARFLEKHPGIKEVFWAFHPDSAAEYAKIARSPHSTGGMISFSLKGPLEPFYDRLRLAKGPSFGMKTTLICPFMYLAHYDLITSQEGREELAASGLDPDLLRLCVGTEPAEDIIAALAEAIG